MADCGRPLLDNEQEEGASVRTTRLAGTVIAVLALALTAGGCGSTDDAGPATKEKPAGARAAAAPDRVEPLAAAPKPQMPVTVTSADGKKVTVASTERIVPLTPALSETVFTLGFGKQVIARDNATSFEQAKELPVVTRAHNVSAESVLSLKPTVVLAETLTGPAEAIGQIRDAGVPVVLVKPGKSLADVAPRIDAVAAALGAKSAGDELKTRTRTRIDAVQKKLPQPKEGKKPRVAFLYLRGSASVYLIGGGESGATSLLEAAGAVDAGKESGLTKDFTPITSEALAKAAPDALLVMTDGLESVGGVDGLLKIPGVAQTPAGMDRRVVSVDDGVILNYGPRTDQVLRTLVDQLYANGS
ncbi:hemin ABC transporter substrate-binding protein [Streptomyces sp. NBC_00879]|uniref:heme/hemin ABC transporter substrate-binding protein n=1 Tax=Streptomyces sp. NBC_00879 TaxID=2975855 RepID=UPI003866487D